MTDEELYAQVYNEQGFLVMRSTAVDEIGSIYYPHYYPYNRCLTPVHCVALSNYSEWAAQKQRVNSLSGENRPIVQEPGRNYYRTEPTD